MGRKRDAETAPPRETSTKRNKKGGEGAFHHTIYVSMLMFILVLAQTDVARLRRPNLTHGEKKRYIDAL